MMRWFRFLIHAIETIAKSGSLICLNAKCWALVRHQSSDDQHEQWQKFNAANHNLMRLKYCFKWNNVYTISVMIATIEHVVSAVSRVCKWCQCILCYACGGITQYASNVGKVNAGNSVAGACTNPSTLYSKSEAKMLQKESTRELPSSTSTGGLLMHPFASYDSYTNSMKSEKRHFRCDALSVHTIKLMRFSFLMVKFN